METPRPTVTFVVRLSHTGGEGWIGVVERVGTGEKRRCRDLHEIGALIGQMTPPAFGRGTGTTRVNEHTDKEDSGHDDVDT